MFPLALYIKKIHHILRILKVLQKLIGDVKVDNLLRKYATGDEEVCKHCEAYLRSSTLSQIYFKNTHFLHFFKGGLQPYRTKRASLTCCETGSFVAKLDSQHHFTLYFELFWFPMLFNHVVMWNNSLSGMVSGLL